MTQTILCSYKDSLTPLEQSMKQLQYIYKQAMYLRILYTLKHENPCLIPILNI